MYRYERKFHALHVTRAQVELAVKLHPAHFRRAYPPRYVNNIYYDTATLSDFRVHVNGAAQRSKLRLRWYGPSRGVVENSVLELKAKSGQVGNKPAYALPGFSHDGRCDAKTLCAAARHCNVAAEIVERLARSEASLHNRYHRCYYESADHQFRITIDSDQTFQQPPRRFLGYKRRLEVPQLVIIELKYAAALDNRADRIAGAFPFRLSKISKYVYGIQQFVGLLE